MTQGDPPGGTHAGPRHPFWNGIAGFALCLFLLLAGLLLWLEHRAHMLGVLPLLLPLLICLAMHRLMHRHHGSHRGSQGDRDAE